MQAQLLVIGSGAYGTFVHSALAPLNLILQVVDGHDPDFDITNSPATHVIIATPNYTHYDFVAKALQSGKHVLCEKPLALSVEEVKKLYHLAHAYKRYLGIGFVLLNHPFYSFVKAAQETYGPIQKIRVFNHAAENTLEPDWYWNKEQSGGWFLVSEIHWYHLFAWLTGTKSLEVQEAREEIKDGRTIATWSRVTTPENQVLEIDHRLDLTKLTAWAKVEILFAEGKVVIDDWVPRSCSLPTEPKDMQLLITDTFIQVGSKIIDERERDEIYRAMVRENVKRLITEHPTNESPEMILAHRTAIEAQKKSEATSGPARE